VFFAAAFVQVDEAKRGGSDRAIPFSSAIARKAS